MREYVCPWWLAYTFDHRLRSLVHKPEKLYGGYVSPGMTAVDIGCGLGFNALGLAGLVGPTGKVIALDIQQKMLDGVMRRARKQGLASRIQPHLAGEDDFALHVDAEFVLAFYMVHEVPDCSRFMPQVRNILGNGGLFMMIEPPFHVTEKAFEKSIHIAEESGLILKDRPIVRFGRAAVFGRSS
jgi:ubiquinone/menaquinone biosynthesis C-methylase UbiE